MTAVHSLQATFARGEASPRLRVRSDIEHWRGFLDKCRNAVIMRQGGVRRRPGTRYAGLAKGQSSDSIVRLIRFVFSVDQSYIIELGNLYARFWTQGGPVLSGGSPYEIVTPWTAADLARLQFDQSADVLYLVHPNYAPRKLTRLAETNWTITDVPFEDGPYGPLDTTPTVLSLGSRGRLTPTSETFTVGGSFEDGVFDFEFSSAVVVDGYSVQAPRGRHATLKAPRSWRFQGSNDGGATWVTLDTRTGETGWGNGERRYYKFENLSSFADYRLDVSANNIDPSVSSTVGALEILEVALKGGGANTQNITLTANVLTGINKGAGFTSGDIGRHVRLLSEDAYWHWGKITSVSSTSVCVISLQSPPLPSTASISTFRLGAFSSATGYPGAVTLFQERLVYGGTREEPNTVWGSVIGDYDEFSTSIPLKPDDAFTFTLADLSPIHWLAESSDILIGTASSARSLSAADKNEGFSATNLAQGRPIRAGFAAHQPAFMADALLAISRFRNSVREVVYSFEANGYVAPDSTILSEHIPKVGVKELAACSDPNALVFGALNNGGLMAITYEREQNMLGAHLHTLGGGGFVESVASIPGVGRDELWMVVRRTRPNATIMRTIEVLQADFDGGVAKDAIYLDCSLTYNGSPASTVSGFSHLNGFSVGSMADGATQAPVTIASGSYTVPDGLEAGTIHVGFTYESLVKTMPLAQGMGDGSALGRRKRVKKVIVHLHETGSCKVRAGGTSYNELVNRRVTDDMDSVTSLVSQDMEVSLEGRWTSGGQVEILCDGPQPCTVLGITPVYDMEP
jgi:hypothetical protein